MTDYEVISENGDCPTGLPDFDLEGWHTADQEGAPCTGTFWVDCPTHMAVTLGSAAGGGILEPAGLVLHIAGGTITLDFEYTNGVIDEATYTFEFGAQTHVFTYTNPDLGTPSGGPSISLDLFLFEGRLTFTGNNVGGTLTDLPFQLTNAVSLTSPGSGNGYSIKIQTLGDCAGPGCVCVDEMGEATPCPSCECSTLVNLEVGDFGCTGPNSAAFFDTFDFAENGSGAQAWCYDADTGKFQALDQDTGEINPALEWHPTCRNSLTLEECDPATFVECPGDEDVCAWWRSFETYKCSDCAMVASLTDGENLDTDAGYGVINRVITGNDPVDLSPDACGSGCADAFGDPADLFINGPEETEADQYSQFHIGGQNGNYFIRQPAFEDDDDQPPVWHPFTSPTLTAALGWSVWMAVQPLSGSGFAGVLPPATSIFAGNVQLLWRSGSDVGLAWSTDGRLIARYGSTQVVLPVTGATDPTQPFMLIRVSYDPATTTLTLFERCSGTVTDDSVSSPPATTNDIEVLHPATVSSNGLLSQGIDWYETIVWCAARNEPNEAATLAYLIERYNPDPCEGGRGFVGFTAVYS